MRSVFHSAALSLALARAATPGATATPEDRFLGGPFDGYGGSALWQYEAASSPQRSGPRFTGGNRDGYAGLELRLYEAGSSAQSVGPRFRGGGFDGYDRALVSYHLPGSSPQTVSPRFRGAAYDGSDAARVEGLVNPLAGDDDGDGLPDWWEALHYLSITATDASTDTDGDGAGAQHELDADTDPTESNSVFRVTSVRGATNVLYVTFTCSSNRVYDLTCRSNLYEVTWHAVAGRTNLPGFTNGVITLVEPLGSNAQFYSVTVRLP